MRKTNSLKAFFTMCLLCVVGTLGAWAQTTETVTFVAGTNKGDTKTHLTKEGITIILSAGDLQRDDSYRIYANRQITIQSSVGNIRNITFTCTGKDKNEYGPGNLKGGTSGSYSFSGKIGTWKGDAENVSLTASLLVRATKIEVTYVAEGTVLSPSISVPSKTFDEPFNVTLSSAEGTNIYYTLNGEDPTTSSQKYTAPITISQTTTLKAIAEKDGKTSEVAEATYTFEVMMPVIEVATKKFNKEFTTSITASNGADIYYTLDGSDPTTESTKYTAPITISETTTLKAMAVKNGQFSKVAEAKYTFSTVLEGDGTFENPYSPEEIIKMGKAPSSAVWVTGNLLGAAIKTGAGYETLPQNITNIAIGEPGLEKCIAICIPDAWKNFISNEHIGKTITVYGNINTTKGYFGRPGMRTEAKSLAGIASIKIKTQEGYATAVIKAPFVVPEGMICSIITDAKDGVLTIENYEAGKVVPAKDNKDVYSGTPVLVKGTPYTEYPLILDKTTTQINSKNLLQAGTGKKFTADADHLYYKLAYDDYNNRTDLGFYWGAADGGAFFVPEGSAYLAIPKSVAASVKSFRLEDATTGITAPIASEGQTVKTVYTIDGRRVQNADHLTKGLYIVNGKKVMIK